MYSDIFCKVYNEFGWNYYPEVFFEDLMRWMQQNEISVKTAMDLACGTGVLCELLKKEGIESSGMDLSEGMIRIARERDSEISYEVADMTTFRPAKSYDLVTCTGDAVNHIADLNDVEKIFQNVYAYTADGGYFIFDLLNENEISDSEPFEMNFTDRLRVWFQMVRPGKDRVNLCIRVYEDGELSFEETIRETIHDHTVICELLQRCGFTIVKNSDQIADDPTKHAATRYIIARKINQEIKP